MEPVEIARVTLPDEAALRAFGACLAPQLDRGDCLLLVGEIGAGKSVLSRTIIQTRLAAIDRMEDVPSPTFTLVQTYALDTVELWHCDLYRLTQPEEIDALGLEDAYAAAITLIEWPDRLGDSMPPDALVVALHIPENTPGQRTMTLTALGPGWAPRLAPCLDLAA
jgi:tRNA threonylcarbamoyl adenosine modification protein YjeE